MDVIIIYVVLVNLIAFLMYGVDKWNARKNQWRISEKMLLSIAAVGGSVGAYVGMQFFHHKTKKPKFYIGVPFIFLVQISVLIYIYC